MSNERVLYCSNCELAKEYIPNDITFSFPTCSANNEIIYTENFNLLIDNLNQIRDFGDKDSNTIRQPNTDNLSKKNKGDIIYFDEYQQLLTLIDNNLANFTLHSIILEEFFNDLKLKFENYKIPTSRGYDVQCCSDCSFCDYTCDCSYCDRGWCHCEHYGPCGSDAG